jgi:hypothetical protein
MSVFPISRLKSLALFYDVEGRSIRRSRKINFLRFSPGFISPAEREKGLAKNIPYEKTDRCHSCGHPVLRDPPGFPPSREWFFELMF